MYHDVVQFVEEIKGLVLFVSKMLNREFLCSLPSLVDHFAYKGRLSESVLVDD
jgi:hypothetical protein